MILNKVAVSAGAAQGPNLSFGPFPVGTVIRRAYLNFRPISIAAGFQCSFGWFRNVPPDANAPFLTQQDPMIEGPAAVSPYGVALEVFGGVAFVPSTDVASVFGFERTIVLNKLVAEAGYLVWRFTFPAVGDSVYVSLDAVPSEARGWS